MLNTVNDIFDRIYEDVIVPKNNGFNADDELLIFNHNTQLFDNNGKFNIFYQNMWGIPIFSKNLKERLFKLKQIINSEIYDVIVLLEVWSENDRENLIGCCEGTKYNFHYSFSPGIGIPFWPRINGTGIIVLSKFPIIKTMYKSFSINGIPHHFEHSDYYTSKGVAFCRIATLQGDIELYITHLHASYDSGHLDYLSCRSSQMYELTQFVKSTAKSPLVMVIGDFNAQRGEVPYQIFSELLPHFNDCWYECNQNSILLFIIIENDYMSSVTYGNLENTYHGDPQRIDYIYYTKLPHVFINLYIG